VSHQPNKIVSSVGGTPTDRVGKFMEKLIDFLVVGVLPIT